MIELNKISNRISARLQYFTSNDTRRRKHIVFRNWASPRLCAYILLCYRQQDKTPIGAGEPYAYFSVCQNIEENACQKSAHAESCWHGLSEKCAKQRPEKPLRDVRGDHQASSVRPPSLFRPRRMLVRNVQNACEKWAKCLCEVLKSLVPASRKVSWRLQCGFCELQNENFLSSWGAYSSLSDVKISLFTYHTCDYLFSFPILRASRTEGRNNEFSGIRKVKVSKCKMRGFTISTIKMTWPTFRQIQNLD